MRVFLNYFWALVFVPRAYNLYSLSVNGFKQFSENSAEVQVIQCIGWEKQDTAFTGHGWFSRQDSVSYSPHPPPNSTLIPIHTHAHTLADIHTFSLANNKLFPATARPRHTLFDDEGTVLGLSGTFTQAAHVLCIDPEEVLVAHHQLCDGDACAVVVLNAGVPFLNSRLREVKKGYDTDICFFKICMDSFSSANSKPILYHCLLVCFLNGVAGYGGIAAVFWRGPD